MSTYQEATGITIEEAFEEFDKNNPWIWGKFYDMVFQALKVGKTKMSSKMIINVIRWQEGLKTETNESYKINDAFTAMYARKFIKQNPLHEDIFETRTLRAKGKEEEIFTGRLFD